MSHRLERSVFLQATDDMPIEVLVPVLVVKREEVRFRELLDGISFNKKKFRKSLEMPSIILVSASSLISTPPTNRRF